MKEGQIKNEEAYEQRKKDHLSLSKAKEAENTSKKLFKIQTTRGIIFTSNPEKWEDYKPFQ